MFAFGALPAGSSGQSRLLLGENNQRQYKLERKTHNKGEIDLKPAIFPRDKQICIPLLNNSEAGSDTNLLSHSL